MIINFQGEFELLNYGYVMAESLKTSSVRPVILISLYIRQVYSNFSYYKKIDTR